MNTEVLRATLESVRERIERARERAARTEPVEIVAVTKTHGDDVIDAALAVGLRRLGENRVQELAGKVERRAASAPDGRPEWHLIGHLQRNKVRQALPLFDLMHSIDSERIAAELSQEAGRVERDVVGLVQVNTSGEEAKHGLSYDEAVDTVARIVALPRLHIVGLMTMAPFTDDERVLRRTFARARELFERCASLDGFEARWLSMGMSNDFEVAVEEGSTMVRLGTVLFGER